MERIEVAIIGGGAAGLFLATALKNHQKNTKVLLFERGERVGKKLSATGNGQGNISNVFCKETGYFSHTQKGSLLAQKLISRFDNEKITQDFENMGVFLFSDERGRTYPTGKQASSLTDALRFTAEKNGVELRVGTKITGIEESNGGFILTAEKGEETQKIFTNFVVLCTGGKAAKNFGTDGLAYALAQKFGHTLTPLTPSLVQLKTDLTAIKTLKGIKVSSARVTAKWQGGEKTQEGDLLFTDYGVSGDSIFHLSAYVVDKIESGVTLHVDLLPEISKDRILSALQRKKKNFPDMPTGELLGGIVNNQLGRAIFKQVGDNLEKAAKMVKDFPLQVKGSLGFDYAQVTKGGVRMQEVDENLQSTLVNGLYFAGEILDVDGPCGGFNLQWAYASACTVAADLDKKISKGRGQV